MGGKIVKVMAVIAGLTLACGSVRALPTITGSVAFNGGYSVNSSDLASATGFNMFSSVIVTPGQHFGSYASVPDGTAVSYSAFTFNPASQSVTPLWTFAVGQTTYSFNATSMSVSYDAALNVWNMGGDGVAMITGFDDTPGLWVLTASQAGQSFSFASQSAVLGSDTIPVPDHGTTIALFGVALAGLGLFKLRLA